jgi:hypothetical protein
MQILLYQLATVLVFAVLIVLLIGLRTMVKGDNSELSQKLMRWRVGLQFLAIVIIIVYAFVSH